jgi:predicted DNA-binding protein (MmcQ/YjbR family)
MAERRRESGTGHDIPRDVLERVRDVCAGLAEIVEEEAWTGVRWRVGTATVAHVVAIADGWPPAYAAAAGTDGPMCVITVRCDDDELDALAAHGWPYFRPVWGTHWKHQVLGVRIEPAADWDEIGELVAESYRLVAPRRLTRTTEPRGG